MRQKLFVAASGVVVVSSCAARRQRCQFPFRSQLATSRSMSALDNVDGIQPLTLTISNPPTQAQVQAILTKLNDLINALHR